MIVLRQAVSYRPTFNRMTITALPLLQLFFLMWFCVGFEYLLRAAIFMCRGFSINMEINSLMLAGNR